MSESGGKPYLVQEQNLGQLAGEIGSSLDPASDCGARQMVVSSSNFANQRCSGYRNLVETDTILFNVGSQNWGWNRIRLIGTSLALFSISNY